VPMKNPPLPGDLIQTEIIEAAGLTVTAAAVALRVSRPTLVCSMAADLSGGMALRIEKALRSDDGHADAYAVVLRHCQNAQA